MNTRLTPGMAAYLRDFESGWRNPHGIKVKIIFHKTGEVINEPVKLTPAGNLSSADKSRWLPPAETKRKRPVAIAPPLTPISIQPTTTNQAGQTNE